MNSGALAFPRAEAEGTPTGRFRGWGLPGPGSISERGMSGGLGHFDQGGPKIIPLGTPNTSRGSPHPDHEYPRRYPRFLRSAGRLELSLRRIR
jgi:hypothetical protein